MTPALTPAEYNKRLPIPGTYASSWRTLLTLDPATEIRVPGFIVGMYGWGEQIERAGTVLAAVRRALELRINARAGFEPREPREGDHSLRRDAQAIRDILTRRLRVYQFETATARRRFGHLLATHND